MATDTFIVLAASYDTLGAAEADYHAVRDFYLTSGLLDTYDAAVITKDDGGKVRIVVKHEQPTQQQQAVAESEAAVREAEAEAAEAERAAEQYSTTGSRAAASDDLVSRLDDLARLREKGVLSQAEFETAKSRLLSG
jgi:hypothetical protein